MLYKSKLLMHNAYFILSGSSLFGEGGGEQDAKLYFCLYVIRHASHAGVKKLNMYSSS